jgi:oxygen-independent coproporphyrinogen III oxidase
MQRMVDCLSGEIERTALPEKGMKTVYFGGGTPSLLEPKQLEQLWLKLRNKTDVSDVAEITLECNPEDIQEDALRHWKSLGINRLSIGLQSLNQTELLAMNRAHTADQSFACLELLSQFPEFDVSVDLIYGTPWKIEGQWQQELDLLLSNPAIQHLSAYALTTEPKTLLNHHIQKGLVVPATDTLVITQFEQLQMAMDQWGWESYEISNYCRPGKQALHNSNYWNFVPYFGIGPSAHSYDGRKTRYVNRAQNAGYMENIEAGILPRDYEFLDSSGLLNERLMTGLRTKKGVNITQLLNFYSLWYEENQKQIERFQQDQLLVLDGLNMSLTQKGKLVSDYIISELMYVPE